MTLRCNLVKGEEISNRVNAFLSDIEAVYRRHEMSIAHEDGHGCFIITDFSEHNLGWLNECYVEFEPKPAFKKLDCLSGNEDY